MNRTEIPASPDLVALDSEEITVCAVVLAVPPAESRLVRIHAAISAAFITIWRCGQGSAEPADSIADFIFSGSSKRRSQ